MKQATTETYFNKHTPWYGAGTFGHVIKYLRARATPNCSLLDVGCATGDLLCALREQTPISTLAGLDVAENYLAQCRQKSACRQLYLGEINNSAVVTQIGQQFNYVTMGSVLHHVVGKTRRGSRALARQSLQNAWELVAPGGALAVVEPCFTPSFPMTVLFYTKRFFSLFTHDRITLLRRFDNNIGPPVVAYLLPRQLRAMCAGLPGSEIVHDTEELGTLTRGWKWVGIRKRTLHTLIIQKDLSGDTHATP